jgi:hypothetical protein
MEFPLSFEVAMKVTVIFFAMSLVFFTGCNRSSSITPTSGAQFEPPQPTNENQRIEVQTDSNDPVQLGFIGMLQEINYPQNNASYSAAVLNFSEALTQMRASGEESQSKLEEAEAKLTELETGLQATQGQITTLTVGVQTLSNDLTAGLNNANTQILNLTAGLQGTNAVVAGNQADITFLNNEVAGIKNAPAFARHKFYIVDRKAPDQGGGNFASGAWRTRDLNTIRFDIGDNVVSVNAGEVRIKAGRYHCSASAPAYRVRRHQMRVFNVTDNQVIGYGTSEYSDSGTGPAQNRSMIEFYLELDQESAIRLEHICHTSLNTHGLGVNSSFGGESVYATLSCERVG